MRLSTSSFDRGMIALKLFAHLLVFLVVNYLVCIFIDGFYFDLIGNASNLRANYVLRQKSDVFIVGASRALYHIDQDVVSGRIGMSVTNAGSNGKNSSYQLALLNLIIDKHVPKVIVYEIGDYYAHLRSGFKDLFPFYNRSEVVNELATELDRYAYLKFIFPLYKYNQEILSILKWRLGVGGKVYKRKLSLQGEISITQKDWYLDATNKQQMAVIDSTAVRHFERFIKVCESNDIDLFFSYSPWFLGRSSFDTSIICRLADQHDIKYWDFSQDQRFVNDRKIFKDDAHLNASGAYQYSQSVSDSLIKYLGRNNP